MKNPESKNNGTPSGTSTEWDSLSTAEFVSQQNHNFEGERNKNDKTGKERTFSDKDLYPIGSYESSDDRSIHQRDRREWEVWSELIPKENDPKKTSDENNRAYTDLIISMQEKYPRGAKESVAAYRDRVTEIVHPKPTERELYLASEHGQRELAEEAEFDRLVDKFDQAVAEGKISAEHAEALKERQLKKAVSEIEGHRQDYKDSQVIGSAEDAARYEEWFRSRGLIPEEDKAEPEDAAKEEKPQEAPKAEAEAKKPEAEETKQPEAETKQPEAGTETKQPEAEPKKPEAEAETKKEEVKAETSEIKTDEVKKPEAAPEEKSDTSKTEKTDKKEVIEEEKKKELEEEKKKELEEDSKKEGEELSKHEQEIAELQKEIKRLKLELLAEKERKLELINERINSTKEEIELIEEAKKKPRVSLLDRIFRKSRARKAAKSTRTTAGPKDGEKGTSDGGTGEVATETRSEDTTETETAPKPEEKAEEAEKPEEKAKEAEKPEASAEKGRKNESFESRQFKFWSEVGRGGLELMIDPEPLDDEKAAEFKDFWINLSESAKKQMRNYRYKISGAFRTWLQNEKVIPDNSDPLYPRLDDPEDKSKIEAAAKGLESDYDYWMDITEKGVELMESTEPLDEKTSAIIADLWGTLDEISKKRLAIHYRLSSSDRGRALREWIKLNYENK